MPPLDTLLDLFRQDMATIARDVASGRLGPAGMLSDMTDVIAEHHIAAALVGSGRTRLSDLDSATLARLERTIDYHTAKAEAFAREVGRDGWKAAHESRMQLYTGGIKTSYGLGLGDVPVAGAIALPYYPCQGTLCGPSCGCQWIRVDVAPELGHYDFIWDLDESLENCSVCKERAGRHGERSPLVVRYGIVEG